tara:strand:- start:28 stop:198 length:171 start_codon:yes stop_codon:yes gene_type:complete
MIKINLTNEQFNAITSALTSSDIFHQTFEDAGLTKDQQKIWISAFKKFGIDLREDN